MGWVRHCTKQKVHSPRCVYQTIEDRHINEAITSKNKHLVCARGAFNLELLDVKNYFTKVMSDSC